MTTYPGSSLMGLRLQLHKALPYRVSGQVEGAESRVADLTQVTVQLVRSSGPENNRPAFAARMPDESALTSQVRKDGKFSIEGAPPGSYIVRAKLSKPAMSLARAHVTVNDEDVDELALIVPPAATFSGRVAFEDEDYSGARLSMTLRGYDDYDVRMFRMPVSESGEFAGQGVMPGTYRVSFLGSNTLFVTKMELLDQVTEGAKFELLPPGSDQVVVRVSPEEAVIEGRVEGSFPPESPFRGTVSIGITPLTLADTSTLMPVPVESDGTFLVRHLGAGRYQVCAWREEGHGFVDIVSNPHFQTRLDRACETVELKAGQREYVTLKQISISNLRR